MLQRIVLCALLTAAIQFEARPQAVGETAAAENGRRTREIIAFCLNYADGWLKQADPATGLLPRRLNTDRFWNSKDCAADNYPYLLLTAKVTGQVHLERTALAVLETERRLTPRIDSLPDTYDFAKGGFADASPNLQDILFGASEYAKDGLMPITEWLGPGPWVDRMREMVRDIWAHAEVNTGRGVLPSENVEILGNLMQVMSRLYWMTHDTQYKDWAYRIADYYLIDKEMLGMERIALRDHGCEVLGGLSEVYVIAANENPEKREAYRGPLHRVIDVILEKGRNEDGMMPNSFDVRTGEKSWEMTNDSWGYVYDAVYTVGLVDQHAPYHEAVEKAVTNVYRYLGANWERGSADGYADSIESALNLLNRIPCARSFSWVEQSAPFILDKQRPDGILEAWYGDGNSARTMMMYAMYMTQGITAAPWRKDMGLGAVPDGRGGLVISLAADFAWDGILRCDRPRHRDYFHMPVDYPRINQFPEWYTVEEKGTYVLTLPNGSETQVTGGELWHYPLHLEPASSVTLRLRPAKAEAETPPANACSGNWRALRNRTKDAEALNTWQGDTRQELLKVLRIDDLMATHAASPPRARVAGESHEEGYTRRDVQLECSPGREVPVIVTIPDGVSGQRFPAVVCIPGHATESVKLFDDKKMYKRYARELAMRGFVTLTMNVGQHEVRDSNRTLMGERLFDLVRGVDYLASLAEVDPARMGCAGLSLGGEMSMWLGAVDTRMRATVSAGFLTYMNQLEKNHCMCWKEDGLRELIDFPDIYSLIAPRRLLCQIGEKEPPNQFNPVLAKRAFMEVKQAYDAAGASDRAQLVLHGGAHEIELPSLTFFLSGALGPGPNGTVTTTIPCFKPGDP